jgi:hypothetical protein
MHYLFYKNLLEKVKLNKYQLHYAFWNPAIFKNIKLLNLEEEYNNSLFILPNISIYYINKYSNIENYITSLIKNKFCYHEYYKSNIYKKLLVKKFIYHNKDSIIKHLRS